EPFEPLGFDACRRRDAAAPAEAVFAIADDRAADVRQMHADLMRASGAEAQAQQIGVRESRDDGGMRDRVSPPLRHGHARALLGMTRDWRFDVDGTLP